MPATNVLRRADAAKARKRFGAVPTSEALQLLPHNASGSAWADMRRRGVGASELPTVVGVPGAYGSRFQLWWSKTAGWEMEGTEEMAMGTALEPVIGAVWQERNPHAMLCRPGAALFAHPVHPWLMCTPDFLAVSEGWEPYCAARPCVCGACLTAEPVECKAYDGGKGWGKPGTDEVPLHIAVQLSVQCYVLGARRGHVVRMRGKKVTAYTLDFTAGALTTQYLTEGLAFVRSMVDRVPPPLDATGATEDALARLYADLDEDGREPFELSEVLDYRLALAAVNDAERRKQAVVNRIRQRLGAAKTGLDPDGEPFVERRVYKRRAYDVPAGVVDALYPKGK